MVWFLCGSEKSVCVSVSKIHSVMAVPCVAPSLLATTSQQGANTAVEFLSLFLSTFEEVIPIANVPNRFLYRNNFEAIVANSQEAVELNAECKCYCNVFPKNSLCASRTELAIISADRIWRLKLTRLDVCNFWLLAASTKFFPRGEDVFFSASAF